MSRTETSDGAAVQLAADRAAIEDALQRAVARLWHDADDPVERAIRYALEGGGKRIRPVVCVAAFRAVGAGPVPSAMLDVAAALEIVHTYSLVHDDLPCMDDDALRRRRPTTHRVFGTPCATLAGAAMIPAAFRLLDAGLTALGQPAERRRAAARELGRAAGAGGMVAGQVLDLEAEGRPVDAVTLEATHRRKTGALFVGAARLGGIAADAAPDRLEALGVYGAALGFAFQVADDILDEVGATAVIGKDAGRDRALHKATYPALLGLDGAKRRARDAAAEAVAALTRAGLDDVVLTELARFAVERDR